MTLRRLLRGRELLSRDRDAALGRWIYEQTQLRIHVIVTHAFLRSLANLELEPSRVGALRAAARRRRRRSAQPLAGDLAQLRAVVPRA